MNERVNATADTLILIIFLFVLFVLLSTFVVIFGPIRMIDDTSDADSDCGGGGYHSIFVAVLFCFRRVEGG